MPTLTGTVDRVVFRNDGNGYVVARFRVNDVEGQRTYDELTTLVGKLGPVLPGETINVTGEWERHRTHGRHFRVDYFETRLPATTAGVERFLSSGRVKGVGSGTARRLIEYFGDETMAVLESEPERVRSVPGISKKRADRVIEGWSSQRQMRDLLIFLQSNGLPPSLAKKLQEQYGDKCISEIQKDPYSLIDDVRGVGFKTADSLAVKLGLPAESTVRLMAGLQFVVQDAMREGHVYLPIDQVFSRAAILLGVPREQLEPALLEASRQSALRLDHQAVYLPPYFTAERKSAFRLGILLNSPSFLDEEEKHLDPDKVVAGAVRSLGISLADHQIEAATMALRDKVSIITGGPGTGKTMCLHAIINALDRAGVRYSLCAPTGRAAKRMTAATGRPASTIHRLLGFQPGDNEFSYNLDRPLPQQFIIVDEVSMLDTLLFYNLLKAIPPESHLLLVGDADQLPAVGPGNVLRDLLASNVVPSVTLDKLFRQAKDSEINVAAHQIRKGNVPSNSGEHDLFLIKVNGPETARDVIKRMVHERIPNKFNFDPFTDIQVMSPIHRGAAGVVSLNDELQDLLNPKKPGDPELPSGPNRFRRGDKVMQVRNDYEKEIYNGDVGIVEQVDPERRLMKVRFGEDPDIHDVDFESSELGDLTLAYAVSVHKAQGSEFPAVVVPLLMNHFPLLQRNLLYTALTRARQLCVLVYQPRALHIAVHADRTGERYTRLAERLAEVMRHDHDKVELKEPDAAKLADSHLDVVTPPPDGAGIWPKSPASGGPE
jgi:exodeoxyribonuclease V alpha subunit